MTRKGWLIAAVLTLITILSWVIFDVLHTRSKVEIPSQVQSIIEPINPNFDTGDL